MRREDLEAVARVVGERHNLLVLSDEIYSALTYGDTPHVAFSAIPGMQERTILVNGFSKSHSMTGWRLGYAMGPKEIISLMTKPAPVCHHECPYHEPVCRHRGHEKRG